MKKISVVVVIILASLLYVIGAISGEMIVPESSQVSKNQKNEKCSSEVDNLKLCAVLDGLSIKTGEKTAFTIFVINTGNKDTVILNQPLTQINVYDEKGNKLPTILETKASEKKLTDGDFKGIIDRSFRSHRSYETILKSQQSWKRVVKISDDYDLSKKGKYFVEVKVKLPNSQQNGFIELTLNKIEITVE